MPIDNIAQEELARDDAPATVPPENYELWKKARAAVDKLAGETEMAIAEWLTARGLTATTVKHIFLHEDLERFEIKEGPAPPDDERPAHLHGLDLEICKFRLPGVVVAYMDEQTRKFVRTKRNPRNGELELLLRQLEGRQNVRASQDTQAEAPGAGTAL